VFLFKQVERKYLKHLNIAVPGAKRGWFGRTVAVPAR